MLLRDVVIFHRFIDAKLCDAAFMGYYVDYFATTDGSSSDYTLSKVSNHDYFISRRAFFFDLDVWGDEAPNDDPGQPIGTDRNTLLELLLAAYRFVSVTLVSGWKVERFQPAYAILH